MWHTLSTMYLAADGVIPDNPPQAPTPQLQALSGQLISWLKWGVLIAGVAGLFISAIMIVIGRRNRNAMAADGVSGAVWAVGGLALAASAVSIVTLFTSSSGH
jgi:hypothetical protein